MRILFCASVCPDRRKMTCQRVHLDTVGCRPTEYTRDQDTRNILKMFGPLHNHKTLILPAEGANLRKLKEMLTREKWKGGTFRVSFPSDSA